MSDPFLVAGPAVISFSGGRTSGYMLWRILQAHGGRLPDDVVVCFANTGREMPATLDFVRDCGAAWNVPIVWLEFTARAKDGFQVVSHNSAAREGEPFERLLEIVPALPNPVARTCTDQMKVKTMTRYVRQELGWEHWANIIGIRADEGARVERRRVPARERWRVNMPLADAGVGLPEVKEFWRRQTFDLRLNGTWEGNCDGCFLKSRAAIQRMQHDHPARMRWWPRQEAVERGTAGRGRTFRADREPYAVLAELVASMPRLPMDETMVEGGEACGVWCGA